MENNYLANFEFEKTINVDFYDWDCSKEFLGNFIVHSVNIPNQDIVKWGKGEFTISGIWHKNRTWNNMKAHINIKANDEDVKKLGEKIQDGTLTWNDIDKLDFKRWHVDSEEFIR